LCGSGALTQINAASLPFFEISSPQEYPLPLSSRLGIFNHTDSLRLIAFNSPGFDTDGPFLDKTSVDSLSQTAPSDSCGIAFPRGGKRYELSNHLGNVLAVISDRKLQVLDGGMSLGHYFTADIWSARDYYPFGMGMGGRSWSQNSSYRFGFNGKETDEETGLQDYGFRIYHPAISKFLSVDPLAPDYPWYTPYQFAGNKPIAAVDLDGLEEHIVIYSQTAQKALLDYKENGLRSMAIQAAYVMTAQRYPSKEEGGNDWHLENYAKVNWPEDRSAATYSNSAPTDGLLIQGVREDGTVYAILSVSKVDAKKAKENLLEKLLDDRVSHGVLLTTSNGLGQNQEVTQTENTNVDIVDVGDLLDWLGMPGAPGGVAPQKLHGFIHGLKLGLNYVPMPDPKSSPPVKPITPIDTKIITRYSDHFIDTFDYDSEGRKWVGEMKLKYKDTVTTMSDGTTITKKDAQPTLK
jgi:RHS repeat-associated protein